MGEGDSAILFGAAEGRSIRLEWIQRRLQMAAAPIPMKEARLLERLLGEGLSARTGGLARPAGLYREAASEDSFVDAIACTHLADCAPTLQVAASIADNCSTVALTEGRPGALAPDGSPGDGHHGSGRGGTHTTTKRAGCDGAIVIADGGQFIDCRETRQSLREDKGQHQLLAPASCDGAPPACKGRRRQACWLAKDGR